MDAWVVLDLSVIMCRITKLCKLYINVPILWRRIIISSFSGKS